MASNEGRLQALSSYRTAVSIQKQHSPAEADREFRRVRRSLPGRLRVRPPIRKGLTEGHAAVERQPESYQLEEHNADAEDVSLWCDLASPDLGRHRRWRAHGLVVLEIPWPEDLRNAKVNDHDMGPLHGWHQRGICSCHTRGRQGALVGCEHDVCRLQIHMDDAVRVDVSDGHQDLLEDVTHEVLHEGANTLTETLVNCRLQIATGAEVHNEVDVVLVLVSLVEFHDIWMIQAAQVRHLAVQLFHRGHHVFLDHFFDRSFHLRLLIDSKHHLAKGPRSKGFREVVDLPRIL
mmetsp:Transcript_25787/g.56909  ORF Transcript_25787/g.56909 Transcript_25787/m.56909 type:complete len:291 (+) Transcript_25787:978-1850(+)